MPYAVAAALACPDRQVICVTGDGAFGINAMEIDSTVRHDAKAVLIVSNNAAWNIERFDQQFNYGGRVIGTTLAHSDYAAMARALGAHGERVEDPADLTAAIQRALANAPALVDVVTSQTAVSSDARKGLGFVPDYQPSPPGTTPSAGAAGSTRRLRPTGSSAPVAPPPIRAARRGLGTSPGPIGSDGTRPWAAPGDRRWRATSPAARSISVTASSSRRRIARLEIG